MQGFPVLRIGAHKLEGKEVAMKRALAVLSKVRCASGTEYEVLGQVKRKIVFKTRPQPIIEHDNSTTGQEQTKRKAMNEYISQPSDNNDNNNKRKEAPTDQSNSVETDGTYSESNKVARAAS
jgi:hypothetical protein